MPTKEEIRTLIEVRFNDLKALLNLIVDIIPEGIDDVLAKGQALTTDRTIDLNGHKLNIGQIGIKNGEILQALLMDTIAGGGLVLEAPNSNRYLVHIDDNGQLLFTNI